MLACWQETANKEALRHRARSWAGEVLAGSRGAQGKRRREALGQLRCSRGGGPAANRPRRGNRGTRGAGREHAALCARLYRRNSAWEKGYVSINNWRRSLAKRCIMFERRICSNGSRVPAQLAKEKADGSSRRGRPSARLSLFFWPGCMARAALALSSASFSDCRAGRRPNTATFMLILASAPARAVRRCRAGDAADGARRQRQLALCCSRRPARG